MARVIVSDGSSQREIELADAITVAGRSSDNKIHIDDKQASRKHCQFEKTDFGYKLVDLESRNGTRVNDRVVNQALLRPGDRVLIGKFTLTFEDPQFKEPPAEVAARFAPPPAAVAPVPPPAVPAGAPLAAPVAPAPVAAPAPVPHPEPPRSRRSSTGNTTAIVMQRTERIEREREQALLKKVGIGAGLFIVVLLVLIFFPSNPAPVDRPASTRPAADPKKGPLTSEDEKHDFEQIQEFCDKHKTDPLSFDSIQKMCSDFKRRYSNSVFMPQVDAYLKIVADARRGQRGKEIDEGIGAAKDEAKKAHFAGALKRLNALIAKSTDDVEAREKLVKAHDEIVDQAKEHYDARRKEAKGLAAAGTKEEAIRIYDALVASLGNDSVEELAIWSQIAKKELEALK